MQVSRLARSFLYNAGLIFTLLLLVFLIFSALPSDPARLILGVNASEEAVDALRRELNLDRPLYERFGIYLSDLAQLEFGTSFVTRRPVAPAILTAAGATFTYVGWALLYGVLYSLITAVLAYFGHRRTRSVVQAINNSFTSVPSLIVALGIGLFFLGFNVLGFVESSDLRNMLLASTALAVYPACTLSQILIEESDAVRRKQYVTVARSAGFSERRIFGAVVLRNALLPWLAQLSNVAAALVAGSVIVEVVFSLPGLGRLVLQSVLRQDFPMIQGVVLVTSISFLLLNFVTEQVYLRLFPHSDER